MYTLLYLAVLFSTATAAPFELISKRPLHDNQWKRDSTTNCPAYLPDGEYEFPHYITWISQQQPDRAFGSQYEGRVTPGDISSIFSFDVPASRADANCTLEFLFPRQDQLSSSSFTYEGPGNFQFTGYLAGSCPGPETTFNNQPTPGMFPPFPPIHMEPGFAYTLDVGPCTFAAGTCVAGVTSSIDTTLEFFQDMDDCPIGIYNTYSYGLPCDPEHC